MDMLTFLFCLILAPLALSAFVQLLRMRAFWILVGICSVIVLSYFAWLENTWQQQQAANKAYAEASRIAQERADELVAKHEADLETWAKEAKERDEALLLRFRKQPDTPEFLRNYPNIAPRAIPTPVPTPETFYVIK